MEILEAITTRGEDGMDTLTHDDIRAAVRTRYGTIAETRGASAPSTDAACCGSPSPAAGSTSCCGGTATTTLDMKAQAYGYSAEDTSTVPAGANLGLGCGNPIALASLRPGETVLDLGSGAGFDCFLAAGAVDETGHVIGVDVVISNCVINLSPEKAQVFRDALRVLKPGGRLAVSDVVATAPFPETVRQNLALLSSCVAGASLIEDVEQMLRAAGFT